MRGGIGRGSIGREALFGGAVLGGAVLGGRRYWEGGGIGRDDFSSATLQLSALVVHYCHSQVQ